MRTLQTFALMGLIVLAVVPTRAQPELQATNLAKERQELDCLHTGNLAEFASLLAEDAVFVDSQGAAGKAEVVKNAADFRLQAYTIEDVRFVPLSSKSGLLIYKVSETGASHGKPFSAKVYVHRLIRETICNLNFPCLPIRY